MPVCRLYRHVTVAANRGAIHGNYSTYNHRNVLAKSMGGRVTLTECVDDRLAIVTIENIEKRNAMSGKMMLDFNSIVGVLSEDIKSRLGIVVRGKGGNFCPGGDTSSLLDALASGEIAAKSMTRVMNETLIGLRKLPAVSVSLIEGFALGGGAELATATDVRVMRHDARIGFVHSRLGITCGWGGASRLKAILGKQKALELLLSGRILNSSEALRIGLVDRIIESTCSDTTQYTLDYLSDLVSTPDIISAIKAVCHLDQPHVDDQHLEAGWFAKIWGSDYHKEKFENNRNVIKSLLDD